MRRIASCQSQSVSASKRRLGCWRACSILTLSASMTHGRGLAKERNVLFWSPSSWHLERLKREYIERTFFNFFFLYYADLVLKTKNCIYHTEGIASFIFQSILQAVVWKEKKKKKSLTTYWHGKETLTTSPALVMLYHVHNFLLRPCTQKHLFSPFPLSSCVITDSPPAFCWNVKITHTYLCCPHLFQSNMQFFLYFKQIVFCCRVVSSSCRSRISVLTVAVSGSPSVWLITYTMYLCVCFYVCFNFSISTQNNFVTWNYGKTS